MTKFLDKKFSVPYTSKEYRDNWEKVFRNEETMKKYIIVGGKPIMVYTGTGTFTEINVVGTTNSIKEARKIYCDKYDECGGLLLIINAITGEAAGNA